MKTDAKNNIGNWLTYKVPIALRHHFTVVLLFSCSCYKYNILSFENACQYYFQNIIIFTSTNRESPIKHINNKLKIEYLFQAISTNHLMNYRKTA